MFFLYFHKERHPLHMNGLIRWWQLNSTRIQPRPLRCLSWEVLLALLPVSGWLLPGSGIRSVG